MILNEKGGPNHVGNYCSAPMIIDTNKNKILYQSSYFYIGHFSRFFKYGDKIVTCYNTTEKLLVLSGCDKFGTIKTVIMNKEDQAISFHYEYGNKNHHLYLPSRSIVTIIHK